MNDSRGSIWRKWDLHLHTPTSSEDYQDKSVTNEIIIRKLKDTNIAAVAITDHHTIDVDRIKLRMEKFSKIRRWLLKYLMYSGFLKRRVRRRAQKNEHLKLDDFEVRYIVGDGEEFDWGVDYVACGNYNFVKAQGAEEFAPYVCMSDIALSNALGWGLIRTQTIADGCEYCDFRFKKGSDTRISSKTPEVQATIEKIQKSQGAKDECL